VQKRKRRKSGNLKLKKPPVLALKLRNESRKYGLKLKKF
jgi:hypothetical protein